MALGRKKYEASLDENGETPKTLRPSQSKLAALATIYDTSNFESELNIDVSLSVLSFSN